MINKLMLPERVQELIGILIEDKLIFGELDFKLQFRGLDVPLLMMRGEHHAVLPAVVEVLEELLALLVLLTDLCTLEALVIGVEDFVTQPLSKLEKFDSFRFFLRN